MLFDLPMTFDDWLPFGGNVASVIGLGVSALALRAATNAAKAARQARSEVRRANASEVWEQMREAANQLRASVENNQVQEAIVRSRDLISVLSRARLRWERFMLGETRERIDETRAQIHVISRSLSVGGAPTTSKEKTRLLNYCNNIVIVLSEESGRIIAAVEREQE